MVWVNRTKISKELLQKQNKKTYENVILSISSICNCHCKKQINGIQHHRPELAEQPPAHPNQLVSESAESSIYWRRLRGHKPYKNQMNKENPTAPNSIENQ
jgi:hypothetical protein